MLMILLLLLHLLVGGLILHGLRIVLVFLVFELFVVLLLVVLAILSALVVSLILQRACTVLSHALLAHVAPGTALPGSHHHLWIVLLRIHVLYVVRRVVEVHLTLLQSELLLILVAAITGSLDDLAINVD